jgi:transcription-repair coupling factor (superfamily II helicase)
MVKLRPDHKLAVVRDMNVSERVKLARDILRNLNTLVQETRAA